VSRVLSGRVEHVLSGESAHFESLEQLLAFIACLTSKESAQG